MFVLVLPGSSCAGSRRVTGGGGMAGVGFGGGAGCGVLAGAGCAGAQMVRGPGESCLL